jgi:hypothetical protein
MLREKDVGGIPFFVYLIPVELLCYPAIILLALTSAFLCLNLMLIRIGWWSDVFSGISFSHEIPQKCSRLPPLGAIFLSAPPLTWNPESAPDIW